MKIIKRLSKMHLVAEFPLYNPITKQKDIYPGDRRVINDTSHPNYNEMWEWDRLDIRRWNEWYTGKDY